MKEASTFLLFILPSDDVSELKSGNVDWLCVDAGFRLAALVRLVPELQAVACDAEFEGSDHAAGLLEYASLKQTAWILGSVVYSSSSGESFEAVTVDGLYEGGEFWRLVCEKSHHEKSNPKSKSTSATEKSKVFSMGRESIDDRSG